jgi:uncharacterized protein YjiS (DUF1127 family)
MRPNFFDFEPYRPRDPCAPCRQLVELLHAGGALARQWLKRIHERHELVRLDDRMLRDIGVTPSEVAREMGKPFWRA